MSTCVRINTRLYAACAELAREKLHLGAAATLDLSGLRAAMTTTRRVDLPTIQQMISAEPLRLTLGGLAPAAFGSVRQFLSSPQPGTAPEAAAASAQAALATAVATASAAIGTATRDITADAFAAAGVELGYNVNVCRADVATGIEMRRGHEIVLMRVDEGGAIESDHLGLADATCSDRQRELEAAAGRRGVMVTSREEQRHGNAGGGKLIRSAAALRDPSLARAAALSAQPALVSARRALTEEPEPQRSARRVGGRP